MQVYILYYTTKVVKTEMQNLKVYMFLSDGPIVIGTV